MSSYLNFYLPDNSAPDDVRVITTDFTEGLKPSYCLVKEENVSALLKPRDKFSNKGTYGRVLIVAGHAETMGAALLASRGCVYAGAGLTTACIPESGLISLNTSMPEVMYMPRSKVLNDNQLEKYDALAVGPGLGTNAETVAILNHLIKINRPIIADADALNILALDWTLLQNVSPGSILTPHVKEFDTLFGFHRSWYERVQTAIKKAKEMGVVIVLKNRYTFIVDQTGAVFINCSGDPAMAQGGMGDVLTGIIAAYKAQGCTSGEAAILGCFIHGAAGADLAITRVNITASELARQLPLTVKRYIKIR